VNREEILKDFFLSLKICLTNAFSYSKGHPYFIKSVKEFKVKLELVLQSLSPFTIGFTDTALIADGKTWEKTALYEELAHALHQRKVKKIEFREGVSEEELISFFSIISLPQKEFFDAGGLARLLFEQVKSLHISAEELDYSSFLKESGKQAVDIWGQLLEKGLSKDDFLKIEELADNFADVLGGINEEEIYSDKTIPESINRFLAYLKANDRERFNKCLVVTFHWLLREKGLFNGGRISEIKIIFKDLNEKDFADLLWEDFLSEGGFDVFSLEFFSKITGEDKQAGFAEGLLKRINAQANLENNPRLLNKIHGILSDKQEDTVSAVYRNTLSSLLKKVSLAGTASFDRGNLEYNFRYIILSLFIYEQREENLNLILASLDKELDSAIRDTDFEYLKQLWEAIREKQGFGWKLFDLQEKKISGFFEDAACNACLPPEFQDIAEKIKAPLRQPDFYLNRIFDEKINGSGCLKLFFRLFEGECLSQLRAELLKRRQDTGSLARIVHLLSRVDSPFVPGLLKYIYDFANQLVRLEVLKAMALSGKPDFQFLYTILGDKSVALRKESAAILAGCPLAGKECFEILFGIFPHQRVKKKTLFENMQIIRELGAKEATGYIKNLSRKRFFWNRRLREAAKQILKEWDVIKD